MQNLLLAQIEFLISCAQLQQVLHSVESLLLFRPSLTRDECIVVRTGKASGKLMPIIRITSTAHRDFIARVDLWHATHREQHGKC